MLPSERRERIVTLVSESNGCSVTRLADQLDVSPSTIRRDLDELAREELIERTHGGATPAITGKEQAFGQRQVQHLEAKRAIAERAADEIHDGQVVFFDSGTTTMEVAKQVPDNETLITVTNSPVIALKLSESVDTVKLTGGTFRQTSQALVGAQAENYVGLLNFDLLFIGTTGIDADVGLTVANEAEAQLKRTMISNSQQVVLVADGTKLGQHSLVQYGEFEQIDRFVTDGRVSDEMGDRLADADVDVVDECAP